MSFKAFRIDRQGGKIVAAFEQLELEDLSEGEVVIRAQYSAINYKDALAATGAGRILKSFPLIGGIDVAGEVVESAVDHISPGARVVVTGCGLGEERDGGYAEYVRVRQDSVIQLPENISCAEAMCLGTAGFTAALAITRLEHNGLSPERGDVVVTGASGGVGSLAISMLAGLGYDVVALTGKDDADEYLHAIGATKIMRRQEIESSSKPLENALWSGAIDNVGGDTLAWLTRTTDWWGSIASIGLAGGYELHTTVMPFILRGVSLIGVNSVHTPREIREAVWGRLATDLMPAALATIVTRVIEFDQLPEAFQGYLDGSVTGRTIVKI